MCFVERGVVGDPRLFIGAGLELFKIYCPRISHKDLRISAVVYCSVTTVCILCNGGCSQDM